MADPQLVELALAAHEATGAVLSYAENMTDPEPPEPPDPGPVPSGLIYGYAHTNRERLENDTGVLVRADRMYEGGMVSHIDQTKAASLPDRYSLWLSVKGDLRNPPLDDYRSLVASIDRPTYLIYRHEPENDGANPADFKACQAKLSEVIADVGNPLVHFAINLMRSWSSKSAADGGSIAYVPDPSDLACPLGLTWDGYQNAKAVTDGLGPDELFADAMDITDASGHGWWALLETASETDAATWVRDITAWTEENEGIACLYWPSQVDDPGEPDWYPPASAYEAFADVALLYGGTPK